MIWGGLGWYKGGMDIKVLIYYLPESISVILSYIIRCIFFTAILLYSVVITMISAVFLQSWLKNFNIRQHVKMLRNTVVYTPEMTQYETCSICLNSYIVLFTSEW
jgi:hypothetical protein